MNEKGIALVTVLIFIAAFSILAFSLLYIVLVENKIAVNLAVAQRAFYYAESGVYHADAMLPCSFSEFTSFHMSYRNLPPSAKSPPYYTVTSKPSPSNPFIQVIEVTGEADERVCSFHVDALLMLLGKHSLVAGKKLTGENITVLGNILAAEVAAVNKGIFIDGLLQYTSFIQGDIYYDTEPNQIKEMPGLEVCFDALAAIAAESEDWLIDDTDALAAGGSKKMFFHGDLYLKEGPAPEGLIVVRGKVYLSLSELEHPLALLAEEGVTLFPGPDVKENGSDVCTKSVFVYSGQDIILAPGGSMQRICGCLVAAGNLVLGDIFICAGEKPLRTYVDDLPPGFLCGLSSVELTWHDPVPRR